VGPGERPNAPLAALEPQDRVEGVAMTKVIYHGVELTVPSEWEDASVVTLLGKKPDRPTMMRAKLESDERPNIVLGRHPLGKLDIDLEIFAEGQTQLMHRLMDGLRVLETGRVKIGGEGGIDGVVREYAFKGPDGVLQQIQVYFQRGGDIFMLTGTGSHDTTFDTLRQAVLAMCDDIRLI